MRSISSSLLTAQKQATHTPYVKLEAGNKITGVTRLDWERLYNGSEDDYFHALTIPDDGSLIRALFRPVQRRHRSGRFAGRRGFHLLD